MRKIKNFIRGAFRYRLTSVFFMICQLVVFSAVFGALGIYNRAYDKEQDKLQGMYKNRISMDIVTMNNRDIFTYAGMDVEQGNIILAGKLSLSFLEQGNSNLVEVILKNNETLPYPMVSGSLPGCNAGTETKNEIAIGRGKLQYAYEENGKKYVTIESEKYEVVGIIGSDKSDYWDYKMVLNIDSIGKKTLEKVIQKGTYTFELSSNKEDLTKAYGECYNNVKSVDENAVIQTRKINSSGDSYLLNSLTTEKMVINVLVYIFCLFNCMLMSEFWLIQRRKEIAIRKIYGMSNGLILVGIAKDIASLCLLSLGLFMVCAGLVNVMLGGQILLMLRATTFFGVLIAMLLVIITTMVYPIYKIMHMNPSQIIGNGD